MSQIFDALQRSETERTGIELPPFSDATELLQIAEQTATQRGTITSCDIAVTTETAAEREMPLLPSSPTLPVPAEMAVRDTGVNQFSQFQSLQVLVPPHSKLVCVTDAESLAAEKFRFLGVRLRQLRHTRDLKKVLITSTIPEEGKSMVAANLACTLARKAGQKTLLLDGDLRRPALAQLFGLGKVPGMCEWLQGQGGPPSSIYNLEGTGLWILPAGSTPRNPLELMQGGRLAALVDQLTTWFDWIIIDSPPVLPLGDTSIWMRLAEGILLVARQGTTKKEQLKRGIEALDRSKLLGCVINGANSTEHSNYYYYNSQPALPQSKPKP